MAKNTRPNQQAINAEFMALAEELTQIQGWGEKTYICTLLGIKPRQGSNLFSGRGNVNPLYNRLLAARLRNLKGE